MTGNTHIIRSGSRREIVKPWDRLIHHQGGEFEYRFVSALFADSIVVSELGDSNKLRNFRPAEFDCEFAQEGEKSP